VMALREMRRLRPAGAATALLVMTACTSGGATTTTEPTATNAPTTSASTTSDLGAIEVGWLRSPGDAERAAELFELRPHRRPDTRRVGLSGGHRWAVDLRCTETGPGPSCSTPYTNAMTDAIGDGGGHDVWPVVEDGVITQFDSLSTRRC
jgi:hypothetical protein